MTPVRTKSQENISPDIWNRETSFQEVKLKEFYNSLSTYFAFNAPYSIDTKQLATQMSAQRFRLTYCVQVSKGTILKHSNINIHRLNKFWDRIIKLADAFPFRIKLPLVSTQQYLFITYIRLTLFNLQHFTVIH